MPSPESRELLVVVSIGSGANFRGTVEIVSIGSGVDFRFDLELVSGGSTRNFRGGVGDDILPKYFGQHS